MGVKTSTSIAIDGLLTGQIAGGPISTRNPASITRIAYSLSLWPHFTKAQKSNSVVLSCDKVLIYVSVFIHRLECFFKLNRNRWVWRYCQRRLFLQGYLDASYQWKFTRWTPWPSNPRSERDSHVLGWQEREQKRAAQSCDWKCIFRCWTLRKLYSI